MINNNRKRIFIIYNIVMILLIVYFIMFPARVIKSSNIKIKNRGILPSFADGTKIEQEFKSNGNYDSFAVQFATYNYIFKDGDIIIDLVETDNNKHCKKNILATSLKDTGPSTINCQLKKNKAYSLQINTKGISNEHQITLYSTSFDDGNHKLLINQEEDKNNLILYYYQNSKSYSNIFYIVLMINIDIILFPFVFLSKNGGEIDE